MDDTIYRQDAIDAIHGAIIDFFDFCDDDEESPITHKDEQLLEINKAISGRIKQLPSAQPEQRWIPCSERLPKEEDYRECMECLDGAVWYYTSHKTIGLGYYYYSTKEWSTINDMKPDGKVIAWMPLPEPYKGGQDD